MSLNDAQATGKAVTTTLGAGNASPRSSSAETTDELPVATNAELFAPESAHDVPAAVRAAVAAFEPPAGYEPFPVPTKNNLQRSLIYFFGRRVQATATGKSQWFCLASPQCRANKTRISTTANTSGCMRHLQVFHQLISPKTVMLNRKSSALAAAAKAEADAANTVDADAYIKAAASTIRPTSDTTAVADLPRATSHDTAIKQSQSPGAPSRRSVSPTPSTSSRASEHQPATGRVNDDDATGNVADSEPFVALSRATQQPESVSPRDRALNWTQAAVVRHLLPIALAADTQLVDGPALTERAIQHHVVELFAAARQRVATALQRQLAESKLPTLHVTLARVDSGAHLCRQHFDGDSDQFVTLRVQFVTAAFALEQHVLDVARFDSHSRKADTVAKDAQHWLQHTLERVGVKRSHVYALVVDAALSSAIHTAAAGYLGRPTDRSTADAVRAVLADALDSTGASVQRLVLALRAFVASASAADYVACFHGLEAAVAELLGYNRDSVDKTHQLPWRALAVVLERAATSWDASVAFFADGRHPNTPALLLAFTRSDVAQCAAMLRPICELLDDMEMTGDTSSSCAEAVVRVFAIQQTVLSAARSLDVPVAAANGHSDSVDSVDGDDDAVVSVAHAQLTPIARSVREELGRRWDAMLTATASASAVACAFFHPCCRHVSFLDATAKTQLLMRIRSLACDALLRQRSGGGSHDDGSISNSVLDVAAITANDDSTPPHKRQKRQLSRYDKLAQQANELAQLGFLDSAAATSDRSGHSNADNDRAAADAAVTRELERYAQHEVVAFCDVPFDAMRRYWQHKAFDYPALAAAAQVVLGHPAVLSHTTARACVRCCVGGRSDAVWPAAKRATARAIEDAVLFLHCSSSGSTSSAVTARPSALSESSAAHVIATLVADHQHSRSAADTAT